MVVGSARRTGFVGLVSCSTLFVTRKACWEHVIAKTGIDSIAWHIDLSSTHRAVYCAQTMAIANGCRKVSSDGQIDFNHSLGSHFQSASSKNPAACSDPSSTVMDYCQFCREAGLASSAGVAIHWSMAGH